MLRICEASDRGVVGSELGLVVLFFDLAGVFAVVLVDFLGDRGIVMGFSWC